MSITRDIKDFALDIGYSKVGITTADSFQDHIDEVLSRREVYDFYAADPRQLLKGAQPKEIYALSPIDNFARLGLCRKSLSSSTAGKSRKDLSGQMLLCST